MRALTDHEQALLEALDEPMTARELAGKLLSDLDVPTATPARHWSYDVVYAVLRRLQRRGLVERRANLPVGVGGATWTWNRTNSREASS